MHPQPKGETTMTTYAAQKKDTRRPYSSEWSTELVSVSREMAIKEAKRLHALGWPVRVLTQAASKVVYCRD